MAQVRSWAGLDVHRASVVAATMDRDHLLPWKDLSPVLNCVGQEKSGRRLHFRDLPPNDGLANIAAAHLHDFEMVGGALLEDARVRVHVVNVASENMRR